MAYLYLKRGTSGLSSIYVYFITVVIVHYWDSILGLKIAAVLLLDLMRYWSGPLLVPGARPNIRDIIYCIIRIIKVPMFRENLGSRPNFQALLFMIITVWIVINSMRRPS